MAIQSGSLPRNYEKTVAKKGKIAKVMHEYKEGTLQSGSKKGPKVKGRSQALAIAMNVFGMGKGKGFKKHMA